MIRLPSLAIATWFAVLSNTCNAFAPASFITSSPSQNNIATTNNYINSKFTDTATSQRHVNQLQLNMFDPAQVANDASNFLSTFDLGSANLLSFSDQGQNLAGIFFQASLLPYLIFLYFLSFRGNRTPELGNFGFQFLLLFVFATIPSGIISKGTYGMTLANVDWLHGGAEALLTATNVLIVLGFRNAMTKKEEEQPNPLSAKAIALGGAAAFAGACALGPGLGFEAHSPFLLGIGDLSASLTESLPWVTHSEPTNALSIPTWAIHFSSVFEFLFAMDIIWNYAKTTGNEKWKGLTWGMLPLHASGIAACTYHFFYNTSSLQSLVTTQAGLTCLGNITLAIAAYRIALSNGWSLSELNPLPASSTSPKGIIVDQAASLPFEVAPAKDSDTALAVKLGVLTFGTAYAVKYGELGLDLPFSQNPIAAIAIVLGIPAITALNFYNKGLVEGGEGFKLPSFGSGEGGGLSMSDVKKYGVSGTVAYVLTELAFWAVAFPVASTALYQSTGHWPDVINDTTDRTTVLGFIFAGANIARLLVPLRLGAALALAPWVDANIISKVGGDGDEKKDSANENA